MDILNKYLDWFDDNPDDILLRWNGKIFHAEDRFVRLDKTFLYVVYRLCPGKTILQNIIGYVEYPDRDEPRVVYTCGLTYRLSTKGREGRIVPADRVSEEEAKNSNPAGVRKYLEPGKGPEHIHTRYQGDVQALKYLSQLQFKDGVPCTETLTEATVPAIWMSARPFNTLILRTDDDGNPLDPSLVNIDNALEVIRDKWEEYTTDAGKGRSCIPYDLVYGQGVVVIDYRNMGIWFRTTRKNLEKVLPRTIEIRLPEKGEENDPVKLVKSKRVRSR